jgi:hypothetical protein
MMLKYNITDIGEFYETLLNHLNFHLDWIRFMATLFEGLCAFLHVPH